MRIPERVRIHFEMRSGTAALLLIVLFALALRLAAFTGLHFSDDPDYASRAQTLLTGHGFAYPDNNGLRIGTWYPAALGYLVFGINNFGLVVYPLVLSIVSIVMIHRLATRLFDEKTGLIAAFLLSFYPLDVELATRLLPDVLLSSFSLLAVYFLYTADIENFDRAEARLRRPWAYLGSGLFLGWCCTVNMSAVVLVVFFAFYFFVSLAFFRGGFRQAGISRVFLRVCCLRYVILVAGFLVVAGLEATLYRVALGQFLLKYTSTVSHYNLEHRDFFQDLWRYPEIMFFLKRGWRFDLPPAEYRYYGFFYFAALPALVYGLVKGGRRFWMVGLWLVGVWSYLQWGTMNPTKWNFLHRLERHMEMVTPAMILVVAYPLGRLDPGWLRRRLAWVAIPCLLVTSLWTIDRRHEENERALLPMRPIHDLLEQRRPAHVFMDTQTIAFQKFLDRYEDRKRTYHPLDEAAQARYDDSLVVIHSENQFPFALPGGVNPLAPPENWEPVANLKIGDPYGGPQKWVRAYRIVQKPIEEIRMDRRREVEAYLSRAHPGALADSRQVLFSWEADRVDGVELIQIRNNGYELEHLEFEQPEGVRWSLYGPMPKEEGWSYEVVKDLGRGPVKIIDVPGTQKDFGLVVLVDDGAEPSFDRYRFFVIARPPEKAADRPSAVKKKPKADPAP